MVALQTVMADEVGPFRTAAEAAARDRETRPTDAGVRRAPFGDRRAFDFVLLDWLDLRNMLLVARTVASRRCAAPRAAARISAKIIRAMLPEWQVNQVVRFGDGALDIASAPPASTATDAATPATTDLAGARRLRV